MEIQRNQEKGNTKERLAMPLNCEIIFSFSSILVEGNAVACFLSPEGLSMCVLCIKHCARYGYSKYSDMIFVTTGATDSNQNQFPK